MIACGRWVMVGLCVFGLAAQAWGSDISWTFQQVDVGSAGSSPMVSLGMRTGATWPTVFYTPSSSSSSLVAAALTPVGWSKTTLDTPGTPSFVRSAGGADGRLGAVWQSSQISPRIQFAQFTATGWQYSTVGTLPSTPSSSGANAPDMAYLPGNRPLVAYADMNGSKIKVAVQNSTGWETETVGYTPSGPSTGSYVTTAVNSQGDIGVAYLSGSSTVVYAQKSLPGGAWNYVSLTGLAQGARSLSLAYGPHDEVGLAVLGSNGGLSYAHFDIQSGQWQTELLATSTVTSPRVDLIFDAAGHPALAYVGTGEKSAVHYWKNDGGGWADVMLPSGVDPTSNLNVTPMLGGDAALALDREGIPVLSYYTSNGLVLAYDPIVTPEPATLLTLAAGVALISRRRRRA